MTNAFLGYEGLENTVPLLFSRHLQFKADNMHVAVGASLIQSSILDHLF